MCRWPLITSVQCTYLNIFFLETTRLIELKFYMEYALDKQYITFCFRGNFTKMGTMPIYSKKIFKFSSLEPKGKLCLVCSIRSFWYVALGM